MPPQCCKVITYEKEDQRKAYPRWEISIYFLVYIFYLLYGFLSIVTARSKILNVPRSDFETGWLHLSRDNLHDEIENFAVFVKRWWPWYVFHIIVSTTVRIYCPKIQGYANALVTVIALHFMVHPNTLGLIVFLNISFFVTCMTEWKSALWILAAIWMCMINIIKYYESWFDKLEYIEFYIFINCVSWTILRSCSFGFNFVNDVSVNRRHINRFYSLQNYLGYTFYFPCLIYGPFMSFKRYEPVCGVYKTKQITFEEKAKMLVSDLFRVMFWWLVMYITLHFLYKHYTSQDIFAAELMHTTFGKHAVGYFLGQFFFLYYIVTYGFSSAFASFDGLKTPRRPRCLGFIRYYSDMWKFFDEGLYEFLFGYIYAKICTQNSPIIQKLFATAVTFAFVFIWHGCYRYVLLWSIINFACLVAEKLFKAFLGSRFYAEKLTKRIGVCNARRLRALLGTQIFIPAAFSNVYFIAGERMGNYLMAGAYLSGPWNYISITLCSYCFFQCSEILMTRKSH